MTANQEIQDVCNIFNLESDDSFSSRQKHSRYTQKYTLMWGQCGAIAPVLGDSVLICGVFIFRSGCAKPRRAFLATSSYMWGVYIHTHLPLCMHGAHVCCQTCIYITACKTLFKASVGPVQISSAQLVSIETRSATWLALLWTPTRQQCSAKAA